MEQAARWQHFNFEDYVEGIREVIKPIIYYVNLEDKVVLRRGVLLGYRINRTQSS
jgi:hypothetical protein